MYDFIIGDGHTASGNIGSGAADYLDESNCTREIGPLVVTYLKNNGKAAAHLRIDKGNSYLYEDCHTRAKQANDIGCNLYVEIHLNSGKNRTGDGTEVCITGKSSAAKEYANRVCGRLSQALNIDNRGLVVEGLIVLNETNMPAILIESMFVDCINPNIYNADTIAKAIAEGLLNQDINTTKLGWNQNNEGWWYCTDLANKYYYKNIWKKIENEWYYFDSKGYAKQNTWFKDNDGKWYWLKSNCVMAIGWVQLKGIWYYLNETHTSTESIGQMACNCKKVIKSVEYSFDKDGHMLIK